MNQSTSSPVASRKITKRNQRPITRLSDNLPDDSNSTAIVRPSFTNIMCTNNYSVSLMTIDPNHNKTTASNSSKKTVITKISRKKIKGRVNKQKL